MADARNNSRTIGYIVGAIVLVLLLAWIFGLFGGDEVADVDGDAPVVTEDAGEAAEDAAEEAEEAAD